MYVGSGQARPKMCFKMMSAAVAHIAAQLQSSGVRVHELSKRPDITQVPQPKRNRNAVTTTRSRGANARSSQTHVVVWRRCPSKKSATGRSTYAIHATTAIAVAANANNQFLNTMLSLIVSQCFANLEASTSLLSALGFELQGGRSANKSPGATAWSHLSIRHILFQRRVSRLLLQHGFGVELRTTQEKR